MPPKKNLEVAAPDKTGAEPAAQSRGRRAPPATMGAVYPESLSEHKPRAELLSAAADRKFSQAGKRRFLFSPGISAPAAPCPRIGKRRTFAYTPAMPLRRRCQTHCPQKNASSPFLCIGARRDKKPTTPQNLYRSPIRRNIIFGELPCLKRIFSTKKRAMRINC